MDMEFHVGQSLTFGFELGGSAPAPSQQSTIYGNVSCIENVTGSFANGALYGNTSYRMVEYLKSTGTQYIVTDIVPTDSMKIETTVQFDGLRLDQPSQNQGIFGYYAPASVSENYPCYAIMCNCGYYDDETQIVRNAMFYYNYPWTSDIDGMIHLYKINTTGQQQLVLQHGVCRYADLTTDVSGIPATRPLPTVGMPIFGCYSANTGTPGYFPYTACDLTTYNLKIYDGQERLHDLRPAERTQDNELGLLDVMTGVFYTNIGTGTFAKGGYV